MRIERRLADAGFLGDRLHRRFGEAPAEKQPVSRLDDALDLYAVLSS